MNLFPSGTNETGRGNALQQLQLHADGAQGQALGLDALNSNSERTDLRALLRCMYIHGCMRLVIFVVIHGLLTLSFGFTVFKMPSFVPNKAPYNIQIASLPEQSNKVEYYIPVLTK